MTDEEAQLLDAIEEHFEKLVCGDKVEPKIVLTVDEAEYLTWLIHSLYDAVEMYDSFREGRYEQVKEGYDILCPKIAEAKGEQ